DGSQIRRACIELGVPYITTMQAAKAAASAILGMQGSELEVKSVNEYFEDNLTKRDITRVKSITGRLK
ncbi:MAG: hypothetical protein ACNYVW_10870, partial [Methanosarcinales archaeon]